MDPKEWDEIEQLFAHGKTLSEAERKTWLENLKNARPGMADSLTAMFETQPQADSFFEKSPGAASRPLENPTPLPTDSDFPRLANYQIHRLIGSGGMGTVFEASQQIPVARKVALKIIQPQCATQEHWARFFAEKDILARMNHPAITHLYDFGFTDEGRPFFSMELVEGLPINDYCDRHQLGLDQRIRLFIDVCRGLMHAHQKMVIHRDLKPSNILVTENEGKPIVKILDFGISKSLDQESGATPSMTQVGTYLGTIPYLSPEQAEGAGLRVDTRSDIYTLGVLLFELLTGSWPFEKSQLEHGPLDQRLRTIRTVTPRKPSRQLSSQKDYLAQLSRLSKLSPRQLLGKFQGDLDWIILRAMDKDPEKRYPTAQSFVDDLTAFLAQRPIQTSAPSWHYRLRKWYARNRLVAISSLIIGSALLLGGINSWRTHRQIQTTLLNQKNAYIYLARFLTKGGPSYQGKNLTISQLVREGLADLETDLKDDPVVQSFVRTHLANFLEAEGDLKEALTHFRKAYETRRNILGEKDRYTLLAKGRLAVCLVNLSNHEEARSLALSAKTYLERKGRTKTEEYALMLKVLGLLAGAEMSEGEKEYLLQALRIYQGIDHGTEGEQARLLRNLMKCELRRSNYAEAEKWGIEALEANSAFFGTKSSIVQEIKTDLSRIYLRDHRFEEGFQLFEETVRTSEANLGAEIPSVIIQKYKLAHAYLSHGYFKEAERVTSATDLIAKRQFEAYPVKYLFTELITAEVYYSQRCYPEAIRILEAFPVFSEELQKNATSNLHLMLNNLSTFHFFSGNYTQARWYSEVSLEKKLELSDLSASTIPWSLATLTEICLAQGDFESAGVYADNGAALAASYLPKDVEVVPLLTALQGLTQVARNHHPTAGLKLYHKGLKELEKSRITHSMLVNLAQMLQEKHGVLWPEMLDQ